MQQQNTFSSAVSVTPPSLPKGGGALTGMGESLGQAGPTGLAGMSLPLPITAGRGFAPELSLTYGSGSGNSVFGVGWFCETMRITRRTSHGLPQYDEDDEFQGPDGEVLVKADGTASDPNPATCSAYGDVTLTQTYSVTRYQPRIEGSFSRLEYWLGDDKGDDFWLLHGSDGTLHLFGKTALARISDPQAASHTAQWLLEESLNPRGEHIYYTYLAENSSGVSDHGRDESAMRYLSQVQYGNKAPAADLYLWRSDTPTADWLFTLVFDYGERGVDPQTPPLFSTEAAWPTRQDPFSRYDYGFEIRVYRLCRQILMFHHFSDELGEANTLVSRLLLEYDESPVLTQLTAAQSLAYESDGYVQSLPPLELQYSQPAANGGASWQQMPAMPGLDSWPYALVDLYGEGLPGVLCRTGNAWRYRAPQRGEEGGDSVDYADWQLLPTMPAMQRDTARLMDINGDGQLDWVVAQPGMAGFFTQRPDKSWSGFTPFSALPTEFFHPQAQFAELVGSGLADLVLIGPSSVRLYANQGESFSVGLDVDQEESIQLPIPWRNARELVVFADMLGSGQSHLCRIRYNELTCWPNLGRGHFGQPISLPLPAIEGLDESTFNPENVLLADTDGSGAPDIIYMQHDRVQVWLNQGGNSFILGEPILLPEGVFFDRLCQVTAADVQGTGMAELVLSVPYMTPTHWRFPFNSAKPYLLNGINNNLGAAHTLCYRSSAQSWLDEKQANPQAVPALPFAMQLLVKTLTLDEITGNQLSQVCRYYQGVYDGREREFRGFGYVETEDTSDDALPVGDDTPLAATQLIKTWYHCGREEDETRLYGNPWQGDSEAIILNPTLFTTYQDGQDKVLDAPDETTRWWLYRALKGATLRSETWAQGESEAPYLCSHQRMQVRLVQAGDMPVALALALEQVASGYEQKADDPVVVQKVTLVYDGYGVPLQQVSVAYPRRASHPLSPYPANLPADAWDNTYDEQQQMLRLTEELGSVIHLTDPQGWRLGLPDTRCSNQLVYSSVPAGGISYETLSDPNGLLADTQTRYLAAQSEVIYLTTPPDLRALVDHQRTAVLDSTALQAYDGVDIPSEYAWDKLGYVSMSDDADSPLWGTEHDFAYYADDQGEYLPFYAVRSTQATKLISAITLQYDSYTLCITGQSDSRNSTTTVWDYRFLTPWRTMDINANTQEVQLNALGQAMGGSVYGTENGGQKVGFGLVSDYPVDASMSVQDAIDDATAEGYVQQLASVSVSDMFSWMGSVTESEANAAADGGWVSLLENRFIASDGHIRCAGHQWAAKNPDAPLAKLLAESDRVPVHSAILTADNYPDTVDPDDATQLLQQTAIVVSYSDGFGRALQQCALVPDGQAWHRQDDGEVDTTEVDAAPRWAISGRAEYDNKGQVVRSYQPWFLDSWLYVTDDSMRTQGYSDTLYYDALGRNIRTVTAKGYLRRNTWYSWFTVAEDENDTAGLA
ncbi:SpvB/TcaC N-terminal domain-containing protein [Pseudescherichia sp.]|uniref:SpvB/TcaC N-terminal domain-containing protein n=1 Tax=Pseudescherichia sp. TaxID=2055881 RepID=UPI0028A23EA0|nr:SpvB/TcaC N-terminal domain-containing protein [Pseudescherichia sp.]